MSIQWSQDLSVGVAEIDNQHKELIQKVNSFLDAMRSGKGKDVIDSTLGFLEKYVVYHFGTEEKIMQAKKYPDYSSHKKIHDDFVQEFLEVKKKYQHEGPSLSLAMALQRRLSEWLVNHISQVDKKMGGFLSK